ncbi:unnamed protein product, partial [Ectocarpus sp. 13 AM-2016]
SGARKGSRRWPYLRLKRLWKRSAGRRRAEEVVRKALTLQPENEEAKGLLREL